MSADIDKQTIAFRPDGLSVILAMPDPVENAIVLWAESTTHPETRDREEHLRDMQQILPHL
jgi:hypothetical protein